MMKIQVNDATPVQINYLVAKCKGIDVVAMKEGRATFSDPTDDGALNEMPINYSTDWAQGGPIIEREGISLTQFNDYPQWTANHPQSICYDGPTPLIAAMRCYVASKLGNEVDVPDALV